MEGITTEQLNEILTKHAEWVNSSGVKGVRANLWNADLSGADLRGVDLRDVDLRDVDLRDVDLRDANLKYAILEGANLGGADLCDAKINFYIACPEKGSFIAFKKAGNNYNNYIVELLIPEDARRCSATSKKCRCDKAKVLSITKIDGTSDGVDTVYSIYDETFAYKIGELVEVKDFDDNRWNECSTGIHFFLTRQEAVEY